ncbi:CAP domain-containing protein [Streptomyces sp. NEAU-sy36]|uniref:CAP domain-containing protein n=1 Tax=unclassified Streptomyces TaxID=2593676 RepID=UPI0015D62A37|nr:MULTISPECIES: CAP domain-containing protein [unclassified Streptomyces]QLJ04158.1 CAP domain-containing protein [Streptomyces sp. NEAU-sy36]
MGKHRKTQYFRRMVIGAVAVGAVGVPSVALACSDWPSGTADPATTAATVGAPAALANTPVQTSTATSTATPAPAGIPRQRTHHAHHRSGTAAAPASSRALVPHPGSAPESAAVHPVKTAVATADAVAPTPAGPAPATPAPAAPTASAAAPSSSAGTASGVAARIVQLVNSERAQAGCQPLTLNPQLTEAAQQHSADMAAHQNMSHTGSDGSDPGTRITRAGYTWSAYGENVAYGYATADEVMAGWMNSPGHRANILDCGFREIGVGLAQPGSYWTQDFGTGR